MKLALNDKVIDTELLNYLNERFKGREIPEAYRILARNPKLLFKFIDFRDENNG